MSVVKPTLSMWYCFTPLITLAALLLVKLILLRVTYPKLTFLIIVALIAIPFCIESFFDNTAYDAPLSITVLPFCIILLGATLTQFRECYSQPNIGLRLFKGYDSKFKRCMVITNMFTIFGFSAYILLALYSLEQTWTNPHSGKLLA